MLRIILLATHTVIVSTTAMAQETPSTTMTRAPLSPEVAARVEHLRSYGDRFADAIRLIEAEARKPSWNWNTCSHEAVAEVVPPGS